MKVSVITPSFNHGEFIERTIQSVITQACEIEYIVVDGGSTDSTLAILKRFTNQLTWISESDSGQANAINKGLQRASGEVIGWLNSDDIYYPNAVKKVCQFFEKHPGVDVVYGDAYLIDPHDKLKGFYPTEAWRIQRLKAHCFLSQPAVFFRRAVIQQYGLLDESLEYCMDYEYWLRLALKGANFAYLAEILAGARIYAAAKSSRYCLEASIETLDLLKKKLGYIPPERLASYCGAKVKVRTGLSYPNPTFIFAVGVNLWSTTGQYYQGFERVMVWLVTQRAMLKNFIIRHVGAWKKRWRFR